MHSGFTRALKRWFGRGRRGHELRRDPRNDPFFSLCNLLRLRAEENGWSSLAVGTSYDVLMASSGKPRAGEQLLIDTRHAIESGLQEPTAVRFAVGAQTLIITTEGTPPPMVLLEIAERVRCILSERNQAHARAA